MMHSRRFAPFLFVMILGAFAFSAHAARLYISPSEGAYVPGESFLVQVRVDPQGECVNAAEVYMSYPTNILEAQDAAQGGSIFTLWISEPQVNPKLGTISFSGGIPGGYCGRTSGDPGLTNVLATIPFKFKDIEGLGVEAVVSGDLRFLDGSKTLLNDGFGTEAKLTLHGGVYALSHSKEVPRNAWLEAIRADKVPPEVFALEAHRDSSLFGGSYFAVFSTVDKQTGIDHYEVLESDKDGYEPGGIRRAKWKRTGSPYLLKDQELRSIIKVKAIDK